MTAIGIALVVLCVLGGSFLLVQARREERRHQERQRILDNLIHLNTRRTH